MRTDLEARILDLLRDSPARALPLREVHRALAAELGTGAGSLEQFREHLRAAPGTLVMLEPESPLGDGAAWPSGARAEYERALRDAGLDLEPWVTAFAPGPAFESEARVSELDRSLVELWEVAGARPALRAAIVTALTDARALRRPASAASRSTTPAPCPRS